MSSSLPILWYRRVSLHSAFSADALVRSWKEGRVDPDELLELDGRTLTFRHAWLEDPYLQAHIESIPPPPPREIPSLLEAIRARLSAWHNVVAVGDEDLPRLAERILLLETSEKKLALALEQVREELEDQSRQGNELTKILEGVAADVREWVCASDAFDQARAGSAHASALLQRQQTILRALAQRLLELLPGIPATSQENVQALSQIALIQKRACDDVEKAKADLLAKRRDLDAFVARCNAKAALHGQWRERAEKLAARCKASAPRFIIGQPWELRKTWVANALVTYADTVAPSSVLAVFDGGNDGRYGFLVSWEGLHWNLKDKKGKDAPGFLPWGWDDSLSVQSRFPAGAIVSLGPQTRDPLPQTGKARPLGILPRAGDSKRLASFVAFLNLSNKSLPPPTDANGGACAYRVISPLALRDLPPPQP